MSERVCEWVSEQVCKWIRVCIHVPGWECAWVVHLSHVSWLDNQCLNEQLQSTCWTPTESRIIQTTHTLTLTDRQTDRQSTCWTPTESWIIQTTHTLTLTDTQTANYVTNWNSIAHIFLTAIFQMNLGYLVSPLIFLLHLFLNCAPFWNILQMCSQKH